MFDARDARRKGGDNLFSKEEIGVHSSTTWSGDYKLANIPGIFFLLITCNIIIIQSIKYINSTSILICPYYSPSPHSFLIYFYPMISFRYFEIDWILELGADQPGWSALKQTEDEGHHARFDRKLFMTAILNVNTSDKSIRLLIISIHRVKLIQDCGNVTCL